MHDLISVIDDLRSFDNRINELSLQINEIPVTRAIEEKEKDILHSMDELSQLHEDIRSLFNKIYKKSDAEKDEETIGRLKDILLRMKNGNI
jgi:uncharacterized coiled-coil DUF342 family protein